MIDNYGVKWERPLPKGTIIEFNGKRATVVGDVTPGSFIDVASGGMRQTWPWEIDGVECEVIQMPKEFNCTCGNLEMGFECTCVHEHCHPGKTNYCCEFCGIYTAGTPRCNKCQSF